MTHWLSLRVRVLFFISLIAGAGCSTTPFQKSNFSFEKKGMASYYANQLRGHKTANGEHYDPKELTAAHPSLPFGTRVRVTAMATGKSVIVRINDRGPYADGRIVDLSRRAAEVIGLVERGVGQVTLEVLSP